MFIVNYRAKEDIHLPYVREKLSDIYLPKKYTINVNCQKDSRSIIHQFRIRVKNKSHYIWRNKVTNPSIHSEI